MPKIHFLRHAQSTFNVSWCRGKVDEFDASITEFGKRQARGVRGDYDIVVISPMRRCWQTLENSQITYKEIITLEEGREMKSHHRSDYKQGEEVVPETDDEMFARMEILWKKLREVAAEDKRTLFLGHRKTVLYLTSLIQGRDNNKGLHIKNAQVIEYEI